MSLAIPRVKPMGWALYEILTSGQMTQIDLNISLLDQAIGATDLIAAHAALHSWTLIPTPTTPVVPVDHWTLARVRIDKIGQDVALMVSEDSSASNRIQWVTTMQRNNTFGTIDTSFTGSVVFAFGGEEGTLVVSKIDDAWYTSDLGGTWHQVTWSGYPGTNHIGGYYANLTGIGVARYFLASGLTISYATTMAGTGVGSSSPAGIGGMSSIEFADDGDSILVACIKKSADTFFTLFYSLDCGTTWGTGMALPGTAGSVFYSKYYQKFIAWADTGAMYASSDGQTWVAIGAGTATPANGVKPAGTHSMAAVGPAIVRVFETVANMYGFGAAIAYSLDLGNTWHTIAAGIRTPGFDSTVGIFNGRVYLAEGVVWMSGAVEAPPEQAF